MAKKRYINDNIWEDNYVMDLDPSEKLLFIYLLTNNKVSLCWIYELHMRKIEMELWFDKDLVRRIFDRFESNEKIYYKDWFVFIANFIKNQSMNDNMRKGVMRELESLWWERLGLFCNLKGFERLSNALEPFDILYSTLLNLTKPYLTWLNWTWLDEVSKKSPYWEYKLIHLTDDQYKRLCVDYWKRKISETIEKIESYIINKKKWKDPYTEHNLVIRDWLRRDWVKKQTKPLTPFD